ncbi:MAG: hypothetical protein WCT04_08865 [Planctomycetota bacterium]
MPIRIAVPLAGVALLLCAIAGAADVKPATLSVDVIGLRVARANPLKEQVLWPAGTTISLVISSAAGDLINFDPVDSTIAKCVDDKGTDLRARPKDVTAEQIARVGFSHAPKIDKDGKNCTLEIFAPTLPARGATRVQVQGTVTMWCATQKKETVLPNVQIRNGTKIIGPKKLELSIEEMNEAPRNLAREAMCFVLRSERELDDLAEVKFFRPDGSEVRAIRTSTSTLSIQGAVKVDWSYSLAERLDLGTVKVYTWSDIEKKRVTLDVSVDVGL